MTPNHTTRLKLGFALGFALLALAAPVEAQIPLPSLGQHISTPAGDVDVQADQQGANACATVSTPPLPALPSLPSLPIALPGIPPVQGNGQICAEASPDGVHADAGADAMGVQAGAGADVDTSEEHATAKGLVGTVKSLASSLVDTIRSLF